MKDYVNTIMKDQRLFKNVDDVTLMNQEHDYKKLQQLIEEAFSAHQRADWSNSTARETIARAIVNRFKGYIETND